MLIEQELLFIKLTQNSRVLKVAISSVIFSVEPFSWNPDTENDDQGSRLREWRQQRVFRYISLITFNWIYFERAEYEAKLKVDSDYFIVCLTAIKTHVCPSAKEDATRKKGKLSPCLSGKGKQELTAIISGHIHTLRRDRF